jgi:C4-dicarboxylate transporter DctM subunit
MTWVMVVLPLVLLGLGFPVFLILLATSAVALLFFSNVPTTITHQIMYSSIDKFALLAVPFFIFTGELMFRGGMASRLLRWVASIIGSVRGSLPLTTLGMTTVFSAISGATTAAVAAVGSVTYRRMREAGYSEKFSSGLITSAAAIDNLIPPSLGFIIYGVASDTSVAALFAAGMIPGLLLAGFLAVYIYLHAARTGIREAEAFSWPEFLAASREGLWAFGAIVTILGGIYSGVFSPTEAAGVACVYSIIVTVLVYGEVSLRQLFDIAARSMYLTAQLFVIVAVAGLYAWLLTASGVAQYASSFIVGLDVPAWTVLLIINVFLLFIGCFIDTASAMLVLTPLLVPIAKGIGVDPVHFGVVVVMNLSIGTFTPPFGLNIFVAQALFKVPSASLYPGLVPFIALAIAALMVVTYIPALSLWILKYLF